MINDHYQNNPNDPPTAQSLVLTEADALLSFWLDVRNDDTLNTDEAFQLLSVWGHLRRFAPASLDSEITNRLKSLIEIEFEAIRGRAIECRFPQDWMEVTNRLEEAWDYVSDGDSIYEIERCIREQFKILDNASLVVYAMEKLQPSITSHKGFVALKRSVSSAEEFLADNPDIFLPAAVFASAMLDAYRADLDAFDEELAETTLKHRILQELIDEQQAPVVPATIPGEVTAELVRIFTSDDVLGQPDYKVKTQEFSEAGDTAPNMGTTVEATAAKKLPCLDFKPFASGKFHPKEVELYPSKFISIREVTFDGDNLHFKVKSNGVFRGNIVVMRESGEGNPKPSDRAADFTFLTNGLSVVKLILAIEIEHRRINVAELLFYRDRE